MPTPRKVGPWQSKIYPKSVLNLLTAYDTSIPQRPSKGTKSQEDSWLAVTKGGF